jgi:hypothetical protein
MRSCPKDPLRTSTLVWIFEVRIQYYGSPDGKEIYEEGLTESDRLPHIYLLVCGSHHARINQ